MLTYPGGPPKYLLCVANTERERARPRGGCLAPKAENLHVVEA